MSVLVNLCFPIVLLAASTGVSETSSLPIITVHPESSVVAQGGSVVLGCEATNANLPVLFTHNGVVIDENDPDRRNVSNNLNIRNFVTEFEGEYVCLARNRVGDTNFTVASAPAFIMLRVLEGTVFSSEPSLPYNVTIRVGQPAIIDCASNYTSVPEPSFIWTIISPIERALQRSDNMVIGLNGSLYIRNPTSAHNLWVLRCSITNSPKVLTGYIRLIIDSTTSSPAPPPHILSPPTDVTIVLNPGTSRAIFECIVGGSPLLDVSWTTPVPAGRIYLDPNFAGNRLQAFSLQPSDAGTFTCSVPSVGNFSAQLSFIGVPSLTAGLPGTTQVITYGSSLSLSCDSNSAAISWYWFRNGMRLEQFTGTRLTIDSAGEEDSGSYQCYAINDAGKAVSATYVQVQTIGASIDPELPSQQILFVGSPFTLGCTAIGAPPPTYQWIKDDVPLSESSAQFQIDTLTGSLTITSIEHSHNGEYTCRATNRIGERVIGQDDSSTTLTVITPTVFIRPLESERTLSILLGTVDTLFCDVSSDSGSLLHFSWTKDDQPLNVDGTRLVYVDPTLTTNGSIQIRSVSNEDAGVYVCTVTTTYNGLPAPTITTSLIQVTVTDSPVAPTITEVTSPSSTTVQVIWSITSNLNLIQSFSVEIRLASPSPGEENSWMSFLRNPSAVTLLEIDNLSPFTRYEVRVSAVYINRGSEVVVGDAVPVVTMEDLPGGPPQEVTTVAVTSSDLEIKWQPPSQPNGLITNYTILYHLKDSSATNFTITISGNSTYFILKNLKEEEDYIVRIAAVNSVGMGPFSAERLATTSDLGLREPEGPFYQTVWFIVIMIVVILLLIVGIVILVLVIKYKRNHRPLAGKYHVRPQSGYFGGGGVVDLTDDAASDYLKRTAEMNAFGSTTNSEALDAILERETVATTLTDHSSIPYPSSSRGTCTPQLPNGPTTLHMGFTAPGYINPPSFAEATRLRQMSSRPQSSTSYTTDLHNPLPSEWSFGHNSRTGFGYSSPFEKKQFGGVGDGFGPDTSYSVQTYSDGDSVVTDGTEYSHLAGAGQFERTYHHLQVQTPQNATLV